MDPRFFFFFERACAVYFTASAPSRPYAGRARESGLDVRELSCAVPERAFGDTVVRAGRCRAVPLHAHSPPVCLGPVVVSTFLPAAVRPKPLRLSSRFRPLPVKPPALYGISYMLLQDRVLLVQQRSHVVVRLGEHPFQRQPARFRLCVPTRRKAGRRSTRGSPG